MKELEFIFTQQEQGVVYLFSRYWEQIPGFETKELYDIQMRFPDASMVDTATGADEAIEFEYALNSYNHYKPKDWKVLKDYDALYIVYWEQDADEEEVRDRIKKHYKGDVRFVRLSDYFSPAVVPESDRLGAYWKFTPNGKECADAYGFQSIEEATKRLGRGGNFDLVKPQTDIYRTIGFSKDNSQFIECDHWRAIHFFTTGNFQRDRVPSRLFVKPRGYTQFFGYFQIELAFFIETESPEVEAYFKDFYFYPREETGDRIGLVYSEFQPLGYAEGSDLYHLLDDEGYDLGRTSELIEDGKFRKRIDKIVDRAKMAGA